MIENHPSPQEIAIINLMVRVRKLEIAIEALLKRADTPKASAANDEAMLCDLATYHQQVWRNAENEGPPEGDNRRRVLDALKILGFDSCKRAIVGHHKVASVDCYPGPKSLRGAFPAVYELGKSVSFKLDIQKVREYINKAPKQQRVEQQKPKEPAPPRDKERDKAIAIAGMAKIKEILGKGKQ